MGSVLCRHRRALAAASGVVTLSSGSTYVSVSQNACPSYPGPVRPLAGMARVSARAPAWSTWNRAKRTACCTSASPSTSTSARSQKSSRYSRWSATRPSQPLCLAALSAAHTWSRTAGSVREPDQPYATYLTMRSFWPGWSSAVAVTTPPSV